MSTLTKTSPAGLIARKVRKINGVDWIKYAIYFIVFVLMSLASVSGLTPFAFAFFVALVVLRQNSIACGTLFIGASLLVSLDINLLTYLVPSVLSVWIFIFFLSRNNKKMSYALIWVVITFSQAVYLCYFRNGFDAEDFFKRLICVFLMIVSCYSFVNGLRAIIIRGVCFKNTVDEVFSIAIMIIVMLSGIFKKQFFGFEIWIVVAMFLVLLSSDIYGVGGGAVAGIVAGLSGVLSQGNVTYVATFAVFGVIAGIFKNAPKVVSSTACMLIELAFAYYFKLYQNYSYLTLIAFCTPCLVVSLFPKSVSVWLATLVGKTVKGSLSNYAINKTKKDISLRLFELSDIFNEMESMYMKLISAKVSEDESITKLCEELRSEICSGCAEEMRCNYKFNGTVSKCFSTLFTGGISKGKVTLMDLDGFLTSKCIRVNSLLAKANQLVSLYKQNTIMLSNMDTSKAMVAKQMGAVSKIMSELGDAVSEKVIFNERLKKLIFEELSFNNIVCSDVLICGSDEKKNNVHLVLRDKDAYNSEISQIVSKCLSQKMMVVSREDNPNQKGFVFVELKAMPVFDVVFGASGTKKYGSKRSGDTHSLIRISEEKFMLCLCDGMGSGDKAEEISSTAISLIENFYKASFDSEVILSSVNKLLAFASDDAFSALDICVLSLKTGIADFIKIGSSESLILSQDSIELVEGSSLPLGILEEIQPWTTAKIVNNGDMIVLGTDGVREAFGNISNYIDFVQSINSLNPQTVADSIVEKAVELQQGKPSDDMTVLVCKVFAKT